MSIRAPECKPSMKLALATGTLAQSPFKPFLKLRGLNGIARNRGTAFPDL